MFILQNAANGVAFLTSDILKSRHAFATRLGGVSTHSHTASLNLAFGRGDERETVMENLRLFCEAVGISDRDAVSLPQVHGREIRTVTTADAGLGYARPEDGTADGYVTQTGVPVGIKTADCVPVLMEARDADDRVLAVCAVHAGWRGTVGGIAERGVEALRALAGSDASIYVVMGPAICPVCYEVGEDFFEQVASVRTEAWAHRFIKDCNGRLTADLYGMNRDILHGAGISDSHIDVSPYCTCCRPDLFFSHRYSKGKRGTMLSVIAKESE